MLRELDHQTYEPYGYNADQPYGILYISYGGWSNETTLLGVRGNETSFKNNIDHTIQNGRIEPSLLVALICNNTSGRTALTMSWRCSLRITTTMSCAMI